MKRRTCPIHGGYLGENYWCPKCLLDIENAPDPSTMTGEARVAEFAGTVVSRSWGVPVKGLVYAVVFSPCPTCVSVCPAHVIGVFECRDEANDAIAGFRRSLGDAGGCLRDVFYVSAAVVGAWYQLGYDAHGKRTVSGHALTH